MTEDRTPPAMQFDTLEQVMDRVERILLEIEVERVWGPLLADGWDEATDD